MQRGGTLVIGDPPLVPPGNWITLIRGLVCRSDQVLLPIVALRSDFGNNLPVLDAELVTYQVLGGIHTQ